MRDRDDDKMDPMKLIPFDAGDYLTCPKSIRAFLRFSRDGSPAERKSAREIAARAKRKLRDR